MTTTCRDCAADIVFGVTVKGRRLPLNPERRPLFDRTAPLGAYVDGLSRVQVRSGGRAADFEFRAVPHSSTCRPTARRRGGRRG